MKYEMREIHTQLDDLKLSPPRMQLRSYLLISCFMKMFLDGCDVQEVSIFYSVKLYV